MRFARMFTNSLLAGGLGAAYLTVLVLQLNPHVPLVSGTAWRWLVTLSVFYGLHLAVVFYVLIVIREFFSMDALSPGWASVRVLAWLCASGAAVASALMWLNANAFRNALGDPATQRMLVGAAATTAAALVLLATAVVHYSSGRRAGRVGGAVFALTTFASLALPLVARGPAVPVVSPAPAGEMSQTVAQPGARIVMLLLDGASLEYLRTRSADGRLPNFSRLLASGASMYLATVRPTQPGPVWAAVATGMYPAKNGVRAAALYYARGDSRPVQLLPDHCFSHALVRFGAIRAEEMTSDAWAVRPLWRILSNAGVTAGIVRWPLTFPARATSGFIVTDRFHELSALGQFDAGAGFPPEAVAEAHYASTTNEGPEAIDGAERPELADGNRDRLYYRVMSALQRRWPAQVLALRLHALDPAGHRYYPGGGASFLEGRDEGDTSNSAQQLERAYADIDAAVGMVMKTLREGDLLLVVSGFGMERLHPAKELLARIMREPVMRGTHERAPDGFLIAYGASVRTGRLLRGSIVDVTPTVLYFLGLPIGRDMDGFARTDLFTTAFTSERPIAFIATHNR